MLPGTLSYHRRGGGGSAAWRILPCVRVAALKVHVLESVRTASGSAASAIRARVSIRIRMPVGWTLDQLHDSFPDCGGDRELTKLEQQQALENGRDGGGDQ